MCQSGKADKEKEEKNLVKCQHFHLILRETGGWASILFFKLTPREIRRRRGGRQSLGALADLRGTCVCYKGYGRAIRLVFEAKHQSFGGKACDEEKDDDDAPSFLGRGSPVYSASTTGLVWNEWV